MKRSVKYSACVLGLVLLLSACNGNSKEASTVSRTPESLTQSESEIPTETSTQTADTSSDSTVETSEVSSEASSVNTTSQNEQSSAQTSAESDPAQSIGTSDITITEADSANTELTAGSYTVKIGNKTVDLSGAYVVDGIKATITGGIWESTSSDQNVFLVINGGSLTLQNAALNKTGNAGTNDATRTSDVSDDYNFYGLNSVILVVGENSRATIENCTINSDCSGANAIFSLDEANVTANNVSISTTGNSSRGVYATYGGTITADHMDITTTGAHCAPIATDRGGGYVTVSNSKLSSSGDGSPNIYSTGEIVVENCIGTSTGAQAAVIEGKNSITMKNCRFTVSGSGNNGVMLYQSMSGDAADSDATASISTLVMSDTTISCELDAPMFYITNTRSVITLSGGNTLKTASGNLVSAAAGRWGRDGSNGGTLTLQIAGESYSESVTADEISSVTIQLSDGAAFTGTTDGSVTVE